MNYYLGVDIGTSSVKSLLMDATGNIAGKMCIRDRTYPPRGDCIDKDDVVLELKNVCGNGDRNMNLKVHKGEIVGLGGLVGAGRTELAEVIFGAAAKTSGQIIFRGKEVHPKSPREAIDLGIALVPEDVYKRQAVENSLLRLPQKA